MKNLPQSKRTASIRNSRETGMEKPETLITQFEEPEDVKIFDGFKDMEEDKLKELYDSLQESLP